MANVIVMPQLGSTMTEGAVSQWCKSEGDVVQVGEVICIISTEKITYELESRNEGVFRKKIVNEGDIVSVTTPIAIIANKEEDITNLLSDNNISYIQDDNIVELSKNSNNKIPEITSERTLLNASPKAKKMARNYSIDLSDLKGTGPENRIISKDVFKYMEEVNKEIKTSPVAAKIATERQVDLNLVNKSTRIMKQDVLDFIKSPIKKNDSRILPTIMRTVIAERMTQSWQVAPMVTLHTETDVTNLINFREGLNDHCKQMGIKISYNDILIKMSAKTLMSFPMVNASFDGMEYILHENANIGLAVSLDEGLIVPNVKSAEIKTLGEIAQETVELINKARNNKLTTEDTSGGTFTITNLGMYGISYFTPIINQPEAAILGVNSIIERPVVINSEITIRPVMNLSFTFDHRILDGVEAARFLRKIKQFIENPLLLQL
ncbi:MAG: hypothetical protein VR72_17720 [Clostridiaceae bacterium BRH_c20a]|nr:MAG: hypothetical protein VR72_17720 [Clostridiaceae bacterium BRH_c20a]